MLSTIIQDAQEGAEVITDGESVEKTLSIIELISSGGFAGQLGGAISFAKTSDQAVRGAHRVFFFDRVFLVSLMCSFYVPIRQTS